jgi:hypothetical protein
MVKKIEEIKENEGKKDIFKTREESYTAISKMWEDSYLKLYMPWLGPKRELFEKVVELSKEATPQKYQEFFDIWLKVYNAATGRLVDMPAVSPTREKYERMMKGFYTFINLYAAGMDCNSNFQSVFMEAMRKVNEKTAADLEGEISPEKCKDLYRIWLETFSKTFKEFLKSGHFASDIGKLNSYSVDFQKYNREMLEENYLKPLNLPTKTDIDEINKELYSLKKTVKELNSQIRELTEKK